VTRPKQILIDRFPVANAEFWLSMMARWLAEPGHAERFAADLWPGFDFGGPPVEVIVTDTVTRLRDSLSTAQDPQGGAAAGWGR
jgi:hypothetical protein